MGDTIEWAGEEISEDDIKFEFDDTGTWQGPWIRLRPDDNYRVVHDPDEGEYYAIGSVDVLHAFIDLNRRLDNNFPGLRERLRNTFYDPSNPFLDDYHDYLTRYYAPAQRALISNHSLQRLDWHFKQVPEV